MSSAAPTMRITKYKPTTFWTSLTIFHPGIRHLEVCLRGGSTSDYDKARQDEEGCNTSDNQDDRHTSHTGSNASRDSQNDSIRPFRFWRLKNYVADDYQETVDDQEVTEEDQSNPAQQVVQRVPRRTETLGGVPKRRFRPFVPTRAER
ncbi:unnamed protein product [Umbelopsis vinacea]